MAYKINWVWVAATAPEGVVDIGNDHYLKIQEPLPADILKQVEDFYINRAHQIIKERAAS